MNKTQKHFWSISASLFYAALVVSGIAFLAVGGYFNRDVGTADVLLMSIAVWRLTRLFTYDTITVFIRDWFEGASVGSFRGTLHTLITCPWCTGLWFGFIVVFFYFLTPFTWPVLLILAVSAIGSFFQLLSNYVGWAAELQKRQVLQSDSPSRTTCG